MVRKPIVIIIILMLTAACGVAAADDIGLKYGAYAGFGVGVVYVNTAPLSDWLDEAGVNDFPYCMPTYGIGVHAILIDGLIIGGRISGFYNQQNGDYIDAKMGSLYGFIEIGYAPYNTRRWIIFPSIGIGAAALMTNLKGDLRRFGIMEEPPDTGGMTFIETDENQNVNVGWNYMLGMVGFTFYHNVPFTDNNEGYGQAMFGLTIGGMFEMVRYAWRDEDVSGEADLPAMAFNGMFAQVEIQFGGGVNSRRFASSEED